MRNLASHAILNKSTATNMDEGGGDDTYKRSMYALCATQFIAIAMGKPVQTPPKGTVVASYPGILMSETRGVHIF